jgi:hypothetical protein
MGCGQAEVGVRRQRDDAQAACGMAQDAQGTGSGMGDGEGGTGTLLRHAEGKAQLAREEAKRRKRAEAFRKKLDAMTTDQRIAALRKQLANPNTPRQFIPSIEAKLRALGQ